MVTTRSQHANMSDHTASDPPRAVDDSITAGGSQATDQTTDPPSAHPVVTVHSGKPSLKLPVFKGGHDDTVHVTSFLMALQDYFVVHRVPAHEQVSYLSTCFPYQSNAGIWWRTARTAVSTFSDFERVFKARFALDVANKAAYTARLFKYRQRERDTVDQWFSELSKTASVLAALNEPVADATLLNLFVQGLKPHLQQRVRDTELIKPEYTIADALMIARHAEAANGKARKHASKDAPERLNAMSRVCGYCKRPGHSWDNCRAIAKRKADGTWREKK